jgi:quinol monooxygenase YgiN
MAGEGSATLNATGGECAAGIGGGYFGNAGNITITGGNVTAVGGRFGAGIGGSFYANSGNISISGGNVTATGGSYGAGIGDGYSGNCANINISGGDVTATGGSDSTGINGDTVTISGGDVTATGGSDSTGINGDTVTISGGTIIAKGGNDRGAGIGGGSGTISISDGTVTANGGTTAAGIGGDWSRDSGTITISGGEVTATGGSYGGAGIGGGIAGDGETITISGGIVTASGGSYGGAGIGGGSSGDGGTINISGGDVTATGGNSGGAGIGGGKRGNGGTATISGSDTVVRATGLGGGNDVGSGADSVSGGSLTIEDGAQAEMLHAGTNANPLSLGQCALSGSGAATRDIDGTYSWLSVENGTAVPLGGSLWNSSWQTDASSAPTRQIVRGGTEIELSGSDDWASEDVKITDNKLTMPDKAVVIRGIFEAQPPLFVAQPQDGSMDQGGSLSLSVQARAIDSGTLSYQWYRNTTNSNVGGAAISGATNASYSALTDTVGTYYYYCVVTNTNDIVTGDKTATATSRAAAVTVKALVDAETPVISGQPQDGAVNIGDSITLKVTSSVSDDGTMSYQWYRNTENSNSGGTAISGAISASYSAPTDAVGKVYYYCVVINTNDTVTGDKTATATSRAAAVTVKALVDAETPVISGQPQDGAVSIGGSFKLTVTAGVSDDGTLSYQWYRNTTNSNSGGKVITDATEASYSAPTDTVGTYYYYCVVTNSNDTATGDKTATVASGAAAVTVKTLVDAQTPVISGQPQDGAVSIDGLLTLTVSAGISDGGTLSYQWYRNTTNSNSGGTVISGATRASYLAPTDMVGTVYYYCVITNTNDAVTGNKTATVTSNIAAVTVKQSDPGAINGIESGSTLLAGKYITFSVAGVGMDNMNPTEGDVRYIPVSWSVNPSGSWTEPPYTATFTISKTGDYTLSVVFNREVYTSGAWVADGTTKTKTVSFEVAESDDIPQTGDNTLPLWPFAAGGLVALGMAVWLVTKLKKSRA